MPARTLLRSAAVASVLSFVLPGLGHLSAGAIRRGLLVAIPVVLLLGLAAAVWLVDRGLIVRLALDPTTLLVLVALSVGVGLYRLWATIDAWRVGRRHEPAGGAALAVSAVILAVVVGATVLMHGYVAAIGWSAHRTLTAVFDPTGPQGAIPSESPTPTFTPSANESAAPGHSTASAAPVPTATPTPEPIATPTPDWAADGRLNVLLIGSDAGPGRWSMRADAIILVSVQVETGRVAAFSIPRYTSNVPLAEPAASAYECRCAPDYINALYVVANKNPDIFPGGELRGFVALTGAVETLMGVHLDGMAVADLNGFVRLVDAIGGIAVNVPSEVYDPNYPDPNGVDEVEVYFPPGEQQMDGWHALAYARTRHQDGDVARMGRQQQVVKALQRELGCDVLGNLPAILEVARESLWTNLPLEDVPDMLTIDPGPVESHTLWDVHDPVITQGEIERVQAEVAGAFDGPPPPDEQEPDC